MKNKVFYGILVTGLSILLVLGGCQKPPKSIPLIRIGHAPHDHHSSLYIAAMNPEYFQEDGGVYLKEIVSKKEYNLVENGEPIALVKIESSTGGKELIRKLDEDQFDIAYGGVPAMLHFIDQGSDLKILAPAMTEGAGIVVRNDIPVTSWEEFVAYAEQADKPIRIGYKIAVSVQNLIFEGALRATNISYSNSLDDKDVKVVLVNMHGAKNLIPGLEAGLLDGFVVNQPFLSLAEYKGVGRTIASLGELPPKNKWQGSACCALAGSQKLISENENAVTLLTRLLLRANKLIDEQPELAAKQIAQWLGVPVQVEEKSIPTIHFTIDFDKSWDDGLDYWIESMIEAGKLKGDVKEAYEKKTIKQKVYSQKVYKQARGGL